MADLPNWVYDLVRDLQAQENHPRLLFESGAFEGTATYEWCPCQPLRKLVPVDVREKAEAIAEYCRQAERDATPSEAS